jgi:molecular chaperone GrpE
MFDPSHHEVVEIVETEEHPEDVILQEFTKGYKSPTRIIRPARVKVAKRPVDNSSPVEEQNFESN